MNKIYPLQQHFGQGDAGDFVGGNSYSWGKILNVKGAPWYDSDRDQDLVYDHVKDITEIGNNYEQTVSAMGGNEKTTFYFSMSESYERAHWQTFAEYKKMFSIQGLPIVSNLLTSNAGMTIPDDLVLSFGITEK